MKDPLWFRDAIIYQLHVKSFADSNHDGIGDFGGLIEKLGYIEDLGVTTLWLLPFYPSPLRDDGYDIADYFNVHPSYGTLEDFRAFLDAAHRRGIRVITELVLNHTSDQSRWFQRARRAPAGSPERDFYVWSDDARQYSEARIIFKDFEVSNWTWDHVAKAYFWHRFYSHQPDLNFDNEQVVQTLLGAIDFWLEMGVDGLRLDAVPYLFEREHTNCENLPETHAFLRRLRAHIDERFEDRMLLAEANQWPEDAAAYFGQGDECHMNFHFPLMPRLFMALQMEDRFPILDILEQTPLIPANCQWATFLRNHDELTLEMVTDEERDYMYRVYAGDVRARINLGIRRRLAPLMANSRRRIELIHSLLFSLPGTPVLYYGDEIGMGDNIYLGDRNGVRTPMQWSSDRNAGFSKANPQQLFLPVIIDPEYHYEVVNVENQQRNVSSLFWAMRRMMAVRREVPAFGLGEIEFLHPENPKVLAYLRRHESEDVLVVANLSRFVQVAELDLAAFAGRVPFELFGRSPFPVLRSELTVFTLGPHDFYWLALRPPPELGGGGGERQIPLARNAARWSGALRSELKDVLLPGYLKSCRWFGGRGVALRELRIKHEVPVSADGAHMLLIEAVFMEGLPEVYVLAVQFAEGDAAVRLLKDSPQAIIARWEGDSPGVIYDAVWEEAFRRALFDLIAGPGVVSGASGRLIGMPGGALNGAAEARASSQVFKTDQSNTSLLYGGAYFLKLYRRLEFGPHPDVEVTRFLSEVQHFEHVPRFAGSLAFSASEGTGTVALLLGFTPNQGDAWAHALDSLARFFERVVAERMSGEVGTPLEELIGGVYLERARQLGQRTGEMHLALASGDEDGAFSPEPFTRLWQRSLYQGMRGLLGRTLRQLRRQLLQLPEEVRQMAREVLAHERQILGFEERLLEHKINASKIVIHGDYHLSQVLNTGKDFVIIDFEGEPRRSLGERRLKRSALVDVAAMLRSFDYAAGVALDQSLGEDRRVLEDWAAAWVEKIGAVFLDAYLEATLGAPFIPSERADFDLLLSALWLDKAVYEVGYELSYRLDHAHIPLRALRDVLAGAARFPFKTPGEG